MIDSEGLLLYNVNSSTDKPEHGLHLSWTLPANLTSHTYSLHKDHRHQISKINLSLNSPHLIVLLSYSDILTQIAILSSRLNET